MILCRAGVVLPLGVGKGLGREAVLKPRPRCRYRVIRRSLRGVALSTEQEGRKLVGQSGEVFLEVLKNRLRKNNNSKEVVGCLLRSRFCSSTIEHDRNSRHMFELITSTRFRAHAGRRGSASILYLSCGPSLLHEHSGSRCLHIRLYLFD